MHETNIRKRRIVYIHKINTVDKGTAESELLVTTFTFSSQMIIYMKNRDHGRYQLILGCIKLKHKLTRSKSFLNVSKVNSFANLHLWPYHKLKSRTDLSLKKQEKQSQSKETSQLWDCAVFFFYCVFNGEIHHLFTK